MAAKRRRRQKAATARSVRRGKTGPRGSRAKVGPKGRPGNHARDVARLSVQTEQVIKELQTHLTRIAQIQGQMDRVAAKAEQPWTGQERRMSRSN